MPRYWLVVAVQGDPFPIHLDGSAFQLMDGGRTYNVSNPQHDFGGGDWVSIKPVEGIGHREAYTTAAILLNGCFNLLAARYAHLTSLRGGYHFQNLDDVKDRGSADLVQFVEIAFGEKGFPTTLETDGGCRSAAYYRRAHSR